MNPDSHFSKVWGVAALTLLLVPLVLRAEEWKPIPRRLPPQGAALQPADRERLEAAVAKLRERLDALPPSGEAADFAADVAVYEKAARFALLFDEFYKEQDVKKADDL